MPFARTALRLEEWPAYDRELWEKALRKTDPLDAAGAGAHWRAKTRHSVCTRYGLFLAFLDRGLLDADALPAARLTRENLELYLRDLRTCELSPVTIAGRFRDLREAVRVMQPEADLFCLSHILIRLEAQAEPVRDKRLAIVSPVRLLRAAIREMRTQQAVFERTGSRRAAERFRDALIVAFLATRPIRLANCASIEIGKHLTKDDDLYWCRFRPNEVKDNRRLEFPLPRELTRWLGLYLDRLRPLLLRGQKSSRLWISIRSTPMPDNTIYCRVTHFTKKFVGRAINPHLFRDCVATFIAEVVPEEVGIVAQILGHSTLRTSERFYNHATTISALVRYHSVLAAIRHDATV